MALKRSVQVLRNNSNRMVWRGFRERYFHTALLCEKESCMLKRAVCIISGGMDSALSAKIAQSEGYEIIALHFNYGQRTETKELECFRKIASELQASETYELDLPFFGQIGASALTDKRIDVPTGGIEEGVPVTYVPLETVFFYPLLLRSRRSTVPRHFSSVW